MRKIIYSLLLVVLCVGCGVSKETKEAEMAIFNQASDDCFNRAVPDDPNLYVNFISCRLKATNAYYINTQYPYMDLIEFFNSYALAIARRVDNKEVSPAAGDQAISEMAFQLLQIESQRDFQQYQKRMNWIQLFVTTFNNNYNQNIQCMQTGAFINCY